MSVDNSLRRQYQGFKNTHLLWNDELLGLKQFRIHSNSNDFNVTIEKRLRLGHLIEYFVEFEFEHQKEIQIIGKNLQVYVHKRTIGEFDFIIEMDDIIYHIEVVYKFYLYDKTVGTTEIEHWIGPNRNDSLDQKIEKIRSGQFPLINHPEAIEVLAKLGIETAILKSNAIQQRVHFKGKLFIPFDSYRSGKEQSNELLNWACVIGFYIQFEDIQLFKNHHVYIPSKHDWLVDPFEEVEWMTFEESLVEISKMINEKRAPLVWFKDEYGILTQGFVVWWRKAP